MSEQSEGGRVPVERLSGFIERALAAVGMPGADARIVAALMAEADALGSDGHGIFRLPHYVRRIKAGGINLRPRIRIEQHIDVGAFQPQFGQRFQRLPGMDRLRKEHAVDAARAGPGDDVGKDAQFERMGFFEMAQQPVVDRLRAACGNRLPVPVQLAGADRLPHLFRHPMHVDGQADAAVTDERDPQFLLPHGRMLGAKYRCWQLRS